MRCSEHPKMTTFGGYGTPILRVFDPFWDHIETPFGTQLALIWPWEVPVGGLKLTLFGVQY